MGAGLSYIEAVVVGALQGITELFPVSSLGHSVLLPALIGGRWAQDLDVSAPESPESRVHRGSARRNGGGPVGLLLAGLGGHHRWILQLAAPSAGADATGAAGAAIRARHHPGRRLRTGLGAPVPYDLGTTGARGGLPDDQRRHPVGRRTTSTSGRQHSRRCRTRGRRWRIPRPHRVTVACRLRTCALHAYRCSAASSSAALRCLHRCRNQPLRRDDGRRSVARPISRGRSAVLVPARDTGDSRRRGAQGARPVWTARARDSRPGAGRKPRRLRRGVRRRALSHQVLRNAGH